jgi:hypothetical protein
MRWYKRKEAEGSRRGSSLWGWVRWWHDDGAGELQSMRCGTGDPASCAELQGCSGTCSWGRKSSGEGCYRRWPKGGKQGKGGDAY